MTKLGNKKYDNGLFGSNRKSGTREVKQNRCVARLYLSQSGLKFDHRSKGIRMEDKFFISKRR